MKMVEIFRKKYPKKFLEPSWPAMRALAELADEVIADARRGDKALIADMWVKMCDIRDDLGGDRLDVPPDHPGEVRNYPPSSDLVEF